MGLNLISLCILVYLLCDGLMINSVVVVYDQDVVYISGVVCYVFNIKYTFYVILFIVLDEYFSYCAGDGGSHGYSFICMIYFILEHEVVL